MFFEVCASWARQGFYFWDIGFGQGHVTGTVDISRIIFSKFEIGPVRVPILKRKNIGSARDMWPGPLMYVAWFFQTSNQDLVWSSYVSKFWEFGTWYQEKSNKFNIKIDTSVFCIKLHATSAQAWHCLRPELWFLLDPFPLFWFVWAGHWAVLGLAVLPKVPPDPDGHSTVFLDFCKDLPRPKNPARDTCDFGLWWSGWKCIQKS